MKGVGRYAYHLIVYVEAALRGEWRVLVAHTDEDLPSFPSDFKGELIRLPKASEFTLGMRTFPALIKSLRPSVFIRPAEKIGMIPTDIPTLTVCHDLNSLIWKVQSRRPFARMLLDWVWESLRASALRKSEKVICNSEYVRNKAIDKFHLVPSRVSVAPCGIDERFFQTSAYETGKGGYLLTFATGDEREGYDSIPAIWEAACRYGYQGSLVIAGIRESSAYVSRLRLRLDRVKGGPIRWEPFIDTEGFERLAGLYRSADFFLETSLHEGFGMQLLEAMACGTTCFSTGAGALSEIGAGFPIQLSAEPEKAGEQIARAWKNRLHERDNSDQVAYARSFSWDLAGKAVLMFILETCVAHDHDR